MTLPVAGGGYFRLLPFGVTRRLLARVNEQERMPFIFYLHPWEIDPAQPRVSAGWLSTLRHYTNLDVCAGRLETLLGLFSFGTAAAVLHDLGLMEQPS